MTNFSPELPTLHAHTHRPKALGGTDPVEVAADPITYTTFWIGTFDSTPDVPAMTIPDSALTNIEFVEQSSSATEPGFGTFFANDSFATAGSEEDAHNPAATTEEIFVYRQGMYLVGCTVQWEDGNYPKQTQLQSLTTGGGSLEPLFGSIHSESPTKYPAPIAAGLLSQNPVVTTADMAHQQIDMWDIGDSMGPTQFSWRVQVLQTSGSDKQVLAARLSVVRLGASLL
jgi:hypothetical protein